MKIFSLMLAALAAWASPDKPELGGARIQGTAPGSPITGQARFEQRKDGLKVTLTLQGAPDGQHALHVHEFGDCGDAGKAAGGHYNPDAAPHGHALKDGKKAHPGDLGNVEVKDGGVAFEAVLPRASLNGGKRNVAGRALVLHEKVDDFSQPTGNAGARIACGVIVLVDK